MKLVKRTARFANVIADRTKALIDWQPFNVAPVRSIYNWADKVRSHDPVWHEFLIAKEALDRAYEATVAERAAKKAERKAEKARRKAEKKAAKQAKKAKPTDNEETESPILGTA